MGVQRSQADCIMPSLFPHLPGEGCQILSELFSSSSSSASSPPPPSPPRLLLLLLQFLLDHVCINFHLHFRLANSSPSSSPTSELSVHRWTSTWDLPSSVGATGPQPGTFPARGHRWTSTWDLPSSVCYRWTSTWDLPSSVCTAGP